MEPMTMMLAGGLAAGAAGSALGFSGAKSAERARARAIAQWQANRRRILDAMATNEWQQGVAEQAGNTTFLQGLPTLSASSNTAAPVATLGESSQGGRGDEWAAARATAANPVMTQGNLDAAATQAVNNRAAWANALGTSQQAAALPAKIQSTQTGRTRYKYQRDLADNDAQFAAYVTPNSAYNQQFIGSLLSGVGGASINASPYFA